MKTKETFGSALRQLRRRNANNLSLEQTGKAIDCGIAYMSAIERDERNPPSNEKIEKLLKFLGEEAELDRMLELAIRTRRSIEIPLDGTRQEYWPLLTGLARRIEQGGLENDEALIELLEKLNEQKGK